MSAEVENNKEEETKEQPKSLKQKILTHWQIGIKILELLLCAACVGFMYEPIKQTYQGGSYMHHTGVIYTAYTGFILINVILLTGKVMGEKIPYATLTLFAIEGAVMFAVAGGLLTDLRRKLDRRTFHPRQYLLTMMTISLSCAFANSVVFCIEAFFTAKRQQDL